MELILHDYGPFYGNLKLPTQNETFCSINDIYVKCVTGICKKCVYWALFLQLGVHCDHSSSIFAQKS